MTKADLHCPFCCPWPRLRPGVIQKFGSFKRKNRKTKIQRYRCLDCDRTFSDATFLAEYRQKKRHLNERIFMHLVSAVSLRQTARCEKINYKTVARRLFYFDRVVTPHNARFLARVRPKGGFKDIQFDDMETSEHTKLKPLSIPMTVDAKRRFMISFDVVSMPAKGPLAETSRRKYGRRPDHRKLGWQRVLTATSAYTAEDVVVTSDDHTMYPSMLKAHLPHKKHVRTKGRAACVAGYGELKQGGHDPLFAFNHTAAMNRAGVNRLLRRTWCTTKKPDRLKIHMKMFQVWHNEKILAKLEDRKPMLPF